MSQNQNLIDLNITTLREGQYLLSLLNSDQYSQGFKPAFQSNIGTHFRHIVEHYQCFFTQLPDCAFRYDQRLRDQRLETDLAYAMETVTGLLACFHKLEDSLFDERYTVGEQTEEKEGIDSDVIVVDTNLPRELMFLQTHTVHHYAMIAAMCRGIGVSPEPGIGVAIPTRNYTQNIDQQAGDKKDQESSCAQ